MPGLTYRVRFANDLPDWIALPVSLPGRENAHVDGRRARNRFASFFRAAALLSITVGE
jgi:hypothetical protein